MTIRGTTTDLQAVFQNPFYDLASDLSKHLDPSKFSGSGKSRLLGDLAWGRWASILGRDLSEFTANTQLGLSLFLEGMISGAQAMTLSMLHSAFKDFSGLLTPSEIQDSRQNHLLLDPATGHLAQPVLAGLEAYFKVLGLEVEVASLEASIQGFPKSEKSYWEFPLPAESPYTSALSPLDPYTNPLRAVLNDTYALQFMFPEHGEYEPSRVRLYSFSFIQSLLATIPGIPISPIPSAYLKEFDDLMLQMDAGGRTVLVNTPATPDQEFADNVHFGRLGVTLHDLYHLFDIKTHATPAYMKLAHRVYQLWKSYSNGNHFIGTVETPHGTLSLSLNPALWEVSFILSSFSDHFAAIWEKNSMGDVIRALHINLDQAERGKPIRHERVGSVTEISDNGLLLFWLDLIQNPQPYEAMGLDPQEGIHSIRRHLLLNGPLRSLKDAGYGLFDETKPENLPRIEIKPLKPGASQERSIPALPQRRPRFRIEHVNSAPSGLMRAREVFTGMVQAGSLWMPVGLNGNIGIGL